MQMLMNARNELEGGMAAFIKRNMPLAVLLVDDEIRVRLINKAAQDFFRISEGKAYLRKCGEVFQCINAAGSKGCGDCSACLQCLLWNSVLAALEGQNVSRNKGKFDLYYDGEVRRLTLLVTAAPIFSENKRMVIILIEDISCITRLQGLVPICSVCHRIRNNREEWISLEKYLMTNFAAELTHDYCPSCSDKIRAEIALNKKYKDSVQATGK